MKKSVKIIALCMSLMLLTVFFTGCDFIDELRANHAILSDDKQSITYNGETYRKLPATANIYNSNYYYADAYDNIKITDADVPVLLAESHCYTHDYDDIRDVFTLYYPTNETSITGSIFVSDVSTYDYENGVYYCNEKDYARYSEAIKNNKMDRIGFEYEMCDSYYNYYLVLDVAPEVLSNEIMYYVENPDKMDSELFRKIEDNYMIAKCLMSSLYKCDAEGLIADNLYSTDICKDKDGNAYFLNYDIYKAVKLSDEATSELKSVYFNPAYHFEDGELVDTEMVIVD